MRGRPNLFTSYEAEIQMLPTWTKKVVMGLFLTILFLMPFDLPVINQLPLVRYLGDSSWLRPMSTVLIFAIAALGLNILTGLGGQVSLGHAFFMLVGAGAAAVLGGEGSANLWGLGLPIWLWLPGAGLIAAIVGIIVSPTAVRLRGLYLGIVTLGLVFIGIHLGNTALGRRVWGDPGLGRDYPELDIRLWKEETPLIDVSSDGHWLWFDVSDNQKRYIVLLVVLIVMVMIAKNLSRTRTGRALQAIRDRDVAAEVMGVPEAKYKLIAFAISSYFAGMAGALFASLAGKLPATEFDLFLSVTFIAIILIGGVGTVSGALLGTFFVVIIPEIVEEFTKWLAERGEGSGLIAAVSDALLTTGPGDFGPVSIATQTPGWPMNIFDWNLILYGVLIVVFLIFEPLGLFGIWLKIRNYWKGWPFSY